jgi:8-oxo-dGTP pyrophosphatase MutT (NUDIX family)
MSRSAGGVVVHPDGQRVLLRRPTPNPGYGELEWTHAKGRLDGGMPEQAALREVREELGVEAQVLAEIPGWFEGSSTTNKYFVMRWVADAGPHDAETAEVRWATWDEAPGLIRLGRKESGMARDLEVLEWARERYAGRHLRRA